MPKLDNYSLSNYGLGGPVVGNEFKSKNLNDGPGTLTVPPNQTNLSMYLLATIPAGSDLVSLGPQGNVSQSTIYYFSNSINTAVRLALIDANGVVFQISPYAYTSSNAISVASLLVDTNAKAMIIYVPGVVTLNGTSYAWAPGHYTKQTIFDKNAGDMTLALIASNSASSSATVTYAFQNVAVYSA